MKLICIFGSLYSKGVSDGAKQSTNEVIIEFSIDVSNFRQSTWCNLKCFKKVLICVNSSKNDLCYNVVNVSESFKSFLQHHVNSKVK